MIIQIQSTTPLARGPVLSISNPGGLTVFPSLGLAR
jgi:hypothetical protein